VIFNVRTDGELGQALRAASSDDAPTFINLAAGDYGPFYVSGNRIRITGEPGAIIDARARQTGVLVNGGRDISIIGLEIRNATGSGISAKNSANRFIKGNHVLYCGKIGIFVGASDGVWVEGNHVHHCGGPNGGAGISIRGPVRKVEATLVSPYGTKVTNNHCHHNVQTGDETTEGWGALYDNNPLRPEPYGRPVLFQGNLCHSNGRAGLLIFNGENIIQVVGNIFYANFTQVTGLSAGEMVVRNAQDMICHSNIFWAMLDRRTFVSMSDGGVNTGTFTSNTLATFGGGNPHPVSRDNRPHDLPGPHNNSIGYRPDLVGPPSMGWFKQ
jgi:hypothetical protein